MKNFLYSTALYQLFTEIYVMKFYLVDLFLLIYDNNHRSICVSQAVIMIVATVMTILFHFLLNEAFNLCLQFLLYKDIKDETETEH